MLKIDRGRAALLRAVSVSALLVAGFAVAQPVLAQDDGDADEDQTYEDSERIIVTGSRIANVAPVGATVNVLGREDIETSGQVTLDRMIQDIPQVFDLGFSEASRNEAGGNGNATWSNSINLRGLGPFSTLIISDGHRMTTNGRAISPSVLPTLGVERVEVIADGASAIYGSDAVAGVVNLIQRRNLDGVEAFGRIGSTPNGDFWEWSAGAAIGKQFDNGQLMVAYEHAFRSNLAGDDRDFYTSDQTPFGGPDYRVNQCVPGTLIYKGTTYALPDQYSGGPLQAGTQNLCDSLFGQDLFPEQKYDSVNATATIEVFPDVELLFSGYYNQRNFIRQPGSPTQTLNVKESNAFFVAPDFYVPGSGGYQIAYSFRDDIGQSLYSGYQTNWQVAPGLRVDITDDWTFEGLVAFGRAEDRAGSATGLDRTALQAALDSSNPLTAFDPYGLFRTTDETYAKIFDAEGNFPTNANLLTWQAGVNGPLFALPGGDVRVAVGYEGQDFTMILGQGDPNERRFNRKIHSGYTELYIPIFGPDNAMPGVEDLELTAALRIDDYSDVGSTTNPKFGLNWTVVDGVKLRGSYGTSFRAPTFPEIFGNSTNLYVQNYQNPDPNITTPVPGFGVGSGPNPDLRPETATTWTAGVDVDLVEGLNVGLTYFNIRYKDTITNLLSSLNILTLADEYEGTGVILFGQEAYNRIIDIRDNGIGGTPGPIPVRAFPGVSTACIDTPNPASCVFVDARSLNLGRTSMNGIDFNVRYRTFVSDQDTITLTANGTYIMTYDIAFSPGGDFVDRKNYIGNPLTFKARGSASWDHGPFNLRAAVTHVGGYVNDRVGNQKVSSYTTVDFNLGVQLTDIFDIGVERALLGFELRNAFDTDPPYVNSRPGGNGGGGYDPTASDPIGRYFAVSLRTSL